MAQDPAFLFYSSDFLNGVSDLTMEERGQYITMLCLQHQKNSLSEKTIRLMVGSVSVDVLNKFRLDENGSYYNDRLRQEIEKRKAFTESRRNNGLKGGRKKANAEPNGLPKSNHIEDENEYETESVNEFIVPSLCQIWYSIFPLYTKDQKKDFHAAAEILKFMVNQHGITDIDGNRELITGTFTQIAEQVKKEPFWQNKPLKSIANGIQEFYNKIKNPNGSETIKRKPTRAEQHEAGFRELIIDAARRNGHDASFPGE